MPEETTDVAALFARLKEEVRAAGPRERGCDACPGAAQHSRPGRAALADLGRAADRRQGRPAEVAAAPADALVRRAGVRRPARLQRRDAEAPSTISTSDSPGSSSGREDRGLRAASSVRARWGGADGRRPRRRASGARARGRPRHDPVQVVPGLARARPGVPLAARRPDRVRRPPDRPRDRDEVPRLLRSPPEQGRVGAAPVPPGLRLRRHRARPVRRVGGGPRDASRPSKRLDAVALGEARRVFATSRNVADRLARFNGIDAELLPHPPQTLAYRTAPSEGFLLSVNRLDRAKRIDLLLEAAKAEPSLQTRDRRRGARPRAARGPRRRG